MTRLHLRTYVAPGAAELFCNVLRQDGSYERLAAVVDTGAQVSMLPNDLLNWIVYREYTTITIEQAGIARQNFQGVEALVTITLEDEFGNMTEPFEIQTWFADTNRSVVGFLGVLDRAVLHIDMPQRNGWLEIDA